MLQIEVKGLDIKSLTVSGIYFAPFLVTPARLTSGIYPHICAGRPCYTLVVLSLLYLLTLERKREG